MALEKRGVATTHSSRANHSCVCIEHAPSRETQVKGTLNSPASDASVRAHIRVAQLEFFSAVQGAWGNANSPAGALWSRCGGTEVDIRIIKYGFHHIMFGIKDSQLFMWIIESADKLETAKSNWRKAMQLAPFHQTSRRNRFFLFLWEYMRRVEKDLGRFAYLWETNPVPIRNRKD